MESLKEMIDAANIPILSSILLGILTAISPCPLATNITATAYISKSVSTKGKVLLSGLMYTLGLATSYTIIALVIILGASKFHVAKLFQSHGEKVVGPVMIVIGLIMLNVIKLNFLGNSHLLDKVNSRFKNKNLLSIFLLGALFALAFCPYSGAMYFGVLIPMSIHESGCYSLPFFYALGAGSLVMFFTFVIAFSLKNLNKYFNAVKRIELVMRIIAGLLFILTGLYYLLIYLKIIT